MILDDLLKTAVVRTDAEAYKAMYELNSSALHEMTYKAMYELNSSALYEMAKDPHQVIKYSHVLRQIQYLIGSDSYSFLFEAGKLCGYVEAFEKLNGKQKPIVMPDEEYDAPVVHTSCSV